jgi:hypothetical protein
MRSLSCPSESVATWTTRSMVDLVRGLYEVEHLEQAPCAIIPRQPSTVASVCHREPIVKIRVFSVACQRLVFSVYTYRKGQLKMTDVRPTVNFALC